jgi:hypothetical protein
MDAVCPSLSRSVLWPFVSNARSLTAWFDCRQCYTLVLKFVINDKVVTLFIRYLS